MRFLPLHLFGSGRSGELEITAADATAFMSTGIPDDRARAEAYSRFAAGAKLSGRNPPLIKK